ncbi:MAG: fructose-bisphosphate aldolase [Candidatus Atribacteria bacterium]|nr:fructose-bisphosphate aldolase [Candidatus Atribacteria bacterium]
MSNLKEKRLNNLFNPKSGNTLITPIDHGFYMGAVKGLEDPVGMIEKLIKYKVDGTLMSFGLNKIASQYFGTQDYLPKIMTADYVIFGDIPGEPNKGVLANSYYSSVELAAKYNFDAVKVLFSWGTSVEQQMDVVKYIGALVDECESYEMPLMIEPVQMGLNAPKEKGKDPKVIVDACRIALELGADILKAPYTGDKESFSQITKYSHVPVIILGGPKVDSIKGVLQMAKDSLEAGGKGTCFGRNVWGDPNMENIIAALRDITHKNAEVDAVCKKYNINN